MRLIERKGKEVGKSEMEKRGNEEKGKEVGKDERKWGKGTAPCPEQPCPPWQMGWDLQWKDASRETPPTRLCGSAEPKYSMFKQRQPEEPGFPKHTF